MNNFLSPTFWGSLIAMLLTLGLVAIDSLSASSSDHLDSISKNSSIAIPMFILSICTVIAFTIRYYFALSVNFYGGHNDPMSSMPRRVKWATFLMLCSLFFLSVSSASVATIIGIKFALWLCAGMAGLSLLCVVIFWTLSNENEAKYTQIPISFAGYDLLFLFGIMVILNLFFEKPDDDAVLMYAVMVAVFIYLTMHELVGMHSSAFKIIAREISDFFE